MASVEVLRARLKMVKPFQLYRGRESTFKWKDSPGVAAENKHNISVETESSFKNGKPII